jgi:hypothetical protein
MRITRKFANIVDSWRRREQPMDGLDFARGLASERTRFREIVLASEAIGRERAAIELALNTQLSPEAARRALRELANAPGSRELLSCQALPHDKAERGT